MSELVRARVEDRILAEVTEAKQNKRVAMGITIAHVPAKKVLEEFDFEFQPSIVSKLVRDLATGNFIANAENVLLFGPARRWGRPTSQSHLVEHASRPVTPSCWTAASLPTQLSRAQKRRKIRTYAAISRSIE